MNVGRAPPGPGHAAPTAPETTEQRREAVRAAFRHAWAGYRAAAWGHDELRPVTNRTNDSWGGFGVTLVDALGLAGPPSLASPTPNWSQK